MELLILAPQLQRTDALLAQVVYKNVSTPMPLGMVVTLATLSGVKRIIITAMKGRNLALRLV